MMQEDHNLRHKRFAAFNPEGDFRSLPLIVRQLLDQQTKSWPALRRGSNALMEIRLRLIRCPGFTVRIQFNPRRIVSTAAPVDPATISKRKCFLCIGNLPEGQMGIAYGRDYFLLCNPVPIFPGHLTISHIRHVPQSIEEEIATFLSLARNLSPAFTVFYNGPACGASAPDHMHFQAAPVGSIPVEKQMMASKRRQWLKRADGIDWYRLKQFGREAMVLLGRDRAAVELALRELITTLKRAMPVSGEPMMNVLCTYAASQWRIIVFPRRRHRPAAFYEDSEKKITVSPGLVDMGGLIVTPLERDFTTLDAGTVMNIYEDVSLDPKTAGQVASSLKNRQGRSRTSIRRSAIKDGPPSVKAPARQ